MDIQEAKVLITGGTSGIGLETAKILSDKGADVVIVGRNKEKLHHAIDSTGLKGYCADVSVSSQVHDMILYAIDQMKGLNVLINNAGFGKFASLVDTTEEDFEAQWQTNTKGLFLVGREAAKHFIEQSYGNIINIGSTAAARGFAGGSGYCSSKFAVSALTECWRAELRPHNIRVSQINPSEVVTPFSSRAGLERPGSEYKLYPEDIAHTIVSMLSMRDIGFIPTAEVWATNPNRQ